jgi:hypothetical protein
MVFFLDDHRLYPLHVDLQFFRGNPEEPIEGATEMQTLRADTGYPAKKKKPTGIVFPGVPCVRFKP